MRAPSSLKQEFLKKWILGLQICSASSRNMSIFERKKAIKLSADVAMASARNGRTCWSQAKEDFNDKTNSAHVQQTGQMQEDLQEKLCDVYSKSVEKSSTAKERPRRQLCCQEIEQEKNTSAEESSSRWEFMDDVSLIEETLDYIMSLQAQIDVMKSLANATDKVPELNRKKEQW
ncbi:hypothetical protein JRO89_XS06G0139900 [Xanthoceras sorbifolium]|uniref:IBH1-like N-terminal domain-containing protein n=1 Tax=Xanthoceras sorbifolium TaxID=99658 RepID=A0ABQ8HY47_9ROSI|nr:hypothetical protein JRO89_XS06G0139900 [Xanthoceras sorbifolium]